MKLLLVFITRVFLTSLSLCLLFATIGISTLLFTGNLKDIELISILGILLCSIGCWYIGKPQITWWKKFLSEN